MYVFQHKQLMLYKAFKMNVGAITFVFQLNCISYIVLFDKVTSEALANVTPCRKR